MNSSIKVFLSVVIASTAVGPVYASPGDQKIVKDYTAAKGWTSIIPMNVDPNIDGTDLLSYNSETGHAIVSIGECVFGPS